MSGSEDGQLRSPGDEQMLSCEDDTHDSDSLDIKPPQASVPHTRNSTGSSRRREKSGKEKKHSKERRHKEHNSGRERERDGRGVGGADDEEQRRDHRRDERSALDVEQRYQRGIYEREDTRGPIMTNDRRYQKHYERKEKHGNHNYHHHQAQYHQQPQMHIHRQRQEYYERSTHNYHQGAGGGSTSSSEYHNARHQYAKHGGMPSHMDYGHHDNAFEVPRERRKYNYDQQKDAESLEQDLRSRLLSKRHKYVKGNEIQEHYERKVEHEQRIERNFEDREREHERERERERERAALKAERHKMRREREKNSVIEVLDSPELGLPEDDDEGAHVKRKHKRRSKEKPEELRVEKHRAPLDDPELLARREKLLAAEREKAKRKEKAREELEARRRERKEVIDALSPSAVAASVTAGLNVVLKRKKKSKHADYEKRKHSKKAKESEEDEDGAFADSNSDLDEMNDEEDSESSSDSEASANSYTKSRNRNRRKSKNKAQVKNANDDDEDIQLPESPLSIGELSKSPKHSRKSKTKSKRKRRHSNVGTADEDDDGCHMDELHSQSSASPSDRSLSHSGSRSPSHSHSASLSRSRSRSHSQSRSQSCSSHSHSARSRSRSHTKRSRSRSPSHSMRSRSHSRSHSRSRSRSRERSEERDMHLSQHKTDVEAKEAHSNFQRKSQNEGAESPVCDEKGEPLPNYYPGVQGCRSVEEFQRMNRIEEGTYGVVYRAKDKRTNEIVALKRLKMEKEKEGFPITSLREINTLLKGQHPNIVTVREIVVGSNMDKIYIVMDYVEHDLKSLMETMKNRKQSFFPGEVKCLTQQLLRAVGHLHDNWILHRDLKTSNLLLSHKGILKVGDFGLAREYGSPLKRYTSLVVTLWYRAPELLLGSPEYSTPIDIWSVGCIFSEFLEMAPLFPGKTEIDELNRIFKELGTPNDKIWPGYKDLPAVKNVLSQNSQFAEYPVSNLRKRFADKTTEMGISLLQGLLTYDPKQRLNADAALKHSYFKELPLPIDPSMFPTWPAKSELGASRALAASPKPPSGGTQFKQLGRDDAMMAGDNMGASGTAGSSSKMPVSGIITGNKKSAANTGFVLNAGIDQRQLAMGAGFSLKF